MSVVHVEEEALNQLQKSLEEAGQRYKYNLARLTNLIDEIISGDIQGDPANELLEKFQAKQETLSRITQIIEEAEDYMGLQTNKFDNMMGDIKSGMK